MIDRRAFLKSSGVSLLFFGAGLDRGSAVPGARRAGHPRPGGARRKVLVTIFQRGAMDGLAAVPPLTESAAASCGRAWR